MTTTVASTREELAAARAGLTGRVAVVMTMGALHEGHRQLIRVAREHADRVVVTVFVNPLQFGPTEDFDRYPRVLAADLEACAAESVDLVFAPSTAVMYPRGVEVAVAAGPLGDRLEGAHRPGHFDGVLTVVAKLLHLVRPDVAVFGEKDAQQLALIRAMVASLDFPVEVVAAPTAREPDGLARSSRNRYLDEAARSLALTVPKALQAAVDAANGSGDGRDPVRGAEAAATAAREVLDGEPDLLVDYVAVVDDDSWTEPGPGTVRARLLVAVRAGSTRLIDNVLLPLGTHAG
jgi:pantoate--beta-alanine ligase